MKTFAIIQAHMGSTRLSEKVLLDLAGEPMLLRVINRVGRTKSLQGIIIATSVDPKDDLIADFCSKSNFLFFRGSEEDVLDRYYQAAKYYKADVIIRITSDCPLIDPGIIDLVVAEFVKDNPVDYASNILPPRTFPQGLDTEVFSFNALERAWKEDSNPAWREHATYYIYRHPEKFIQKSITNKIDYSSLRWTVDTAEDLEFVRKIYGYLKNDFFSWKDVLRLQESHPELLKINEGVRQKELPR